jgi:hypothetical protein
MNWWSEVVLFSSQEENHDIFVAILQFQDFIKPE